MRKLLGILAVAGLFGLPTSANAAPVVTPIVLAVAIQGLAPIVISGTATVNVTGATVSVGAGAVTLGATSLAPLVIPVTSTTAIAQLRVTTLSNQAGTFSLGGVTNQVPGEICPATVPASSACNIGGGIGGAMGLTGTIFVSVIPTVVVIPVNLNAALVGQGGTTNVPFTFDAAGWTTGTGLVNTGNFVGGLAGTNQFPGTGVTLVTPTFVLALGNLLPIFAALTLSNVSVPEPGTLLLLGTGLAGLVLVGRKRR